MWHLTRVSTESQKWLEEPRQDSVPIPAACLAQPACPRRGIPGSKTAGVAITFSILLSSQGGQTTHFNWLAVPKYFTNTRRRKRFRASERSQRRLPRGRLVFLGEEEEEEEAARPLPRWLWHKPRLAAGQQLVCLPRAGSEGFTGTYTLLIWLFLVKTSCSMVFDQALLCSLLPTATNSGLSQVEELLQGTGIQALPAACLSGRSGRFILWRFIFLWLIWKVRSRKAGVVRKQMGLRQAERQSCCSMGEYSRKHGVAACVGSGVSMYSNIRTVKDTNINSCKQRPTVLYSKVERNSFWSGKMR